MLKFNCLSIRSYKWLQNKEMFKNVPGKNFWCLLFGMCRSCQVLWRLSKLTKAYLILKKKPHWKIILDYIIGSLMLKLYKTILNIWSKNNKKLVIYISLLGNQKCEQVLVNRDLVFVHLRWERVILLVTILEATTAKTDLKQNMMLCSWALVILIKANKEHFILDSTNFVDYVDVVSQVVKNKE